MALELLKDLDKTVDLVAVVDLIIQEDMLLVTVPLIKVMRVGLGPTMETTVAVVAEEPVVAVEVVLGPVLEVQELHLQ